MTNAKPRSVVRSFSATSRELTMLEAVARYHGLSKSGTIRALLRKEFWRIFPAGTAEIRPEEGARIVGGGDGDD
ncbi:MAG: hypothetical protein ACYTDY_14770 [Planctomycetota bacterium]|jgi:hypothetical protein